MADKRGIWYVDFPTYQYKEDVAALAKESGLVILNARFDAGDGESDVPKLTQKDGSKKAEKPKPVVTKPAEPVAAEPEVVEPVAETEEAEPVAEPVEAEADNDETEVTDQLYSVVKVVDGVRSSRASKADLTKAEAEAYIAERPNNQYDIVEAD